LQTVHRLLGSLAEFAVAPARCAVAWDLVLIEQSRDGSPGASRPERYPWDLRRIAV